MLLPVSLLTVIALIIGGVLGSFATAIIDREEKGGNWFSLGQRSQCPKCSHKLRARDLVPIFSYLFQRGKCRYCQSRISPSYPIIELTSIVLVGAILFQFGFSLHALMLLLATPIMLSLAIIDLKTMRLPLRLQHILLSIVVIDVLLQAYHAQSYNFAVSHLLGGALYWGIASILALVMSKALRKNALGGGDIRLFFIAGLWLGPVMLPDFMIISGLLGVLFAILMRRGPESAPFAFGPALLAALYVLLLLNGSIFLKFAV